MSDTNEPDAYGLLDEGEVHYATPFRDEAEKVLRRTEDKDSVIVPLYRQPTLTDAEREAVEWASKKTRLLGDAYDPERAATMRGLLERFK
jgi:hypothetical protein